MTIVDLFEDEDDSTDEPRPRLRGWLASAEVAPVAMVTFVGASLPALAEYGRIPIVQASGDFWLVGWGVAWLAVIVAWGLFLASAIAGVTAAAVSRRRGWIAVIVAVPLLLGYAAATLYAEPELRAQAYYLTHRADFASIKAFAYGGELAAPSPDDQDGVTLPADLAAYSSNGRIRPYSTGPAPSFLVPVAIGWQRGAIGFAYSADGPPCAGVEAGSCPDGTAVLAELGDGWWWVDDPHASLWG